MKKFIKLILDNFSWKGLVISFLSLLPSIFMAFFPPVNIDDYVIENNIFLMILENVGRVAIIVILCFSKKSFKRKIDVWFVLACVFCALYYAGWIKYFCCGITYELLYQPIWFVPIPLAVYPLLAFACIAAWGRNLPLGIAVIIMAAGHIPNSWLHYLLIT